MADQQEPEIHATANLSPVSPSPLHTAAPLVVPTLQDTVDTIDAMVAAVATNDAPNLAVEPVLDAASAVNQCDIVDDDSFDDAYAEDTEPQPPGHAGADAHDTNDDYAKMFDSPVGSDGEEDPNASVDVSSVAPDSTTSHLQPGQAQNGVPSSSVSASGHQSSHSSPGDPASQPAAQTTAGPDTKVPVLDAAKATEVPTADAHSDIRPSSQDEPSADLNPHPDESHVTANPATTHHDTQSDPPSGNASPSTLASSSSLPPRPPVPQAAAQSYNHHSSVQESHLPAPSTTQGAPGTSTEATGNLPAPFQAGHNSAAPNARNANPKQARDEYQRKWDQFMADERQYMSEAKWDRFPEGSRLFIGNLSSDRASKRDVFELFHRYGRLAQISLKAAYGFVQYHTVEEGSRAIQNLQDFEIKGRRIHLEVSKLQDKSKKERNKSPDRGGRGRDGQRRGEKHQNRDDHRGGRNHSPRRQSYHGRDDSYGRDKFYDSGRGRDRSRSPGYRRHEKASYRRRSDSPNVRSRQQQQGKEIDLPKRYGADVPDVQIILQQEVDRNFVGWVEHAFKDKGLRPEVMFLNPRFPKDQVIQRQAAEGVHAVVELDLRAQSLGKIPIQVFDRSRGSSNVRFDQYVDLDPATAGEVVLRAKAAGAAASYPPQQQQPQQPYPGYQQQYHPPQPQHAPRGPYGAPAPPAPPPHAAVYAQPAPAAAPNIADIAKLVGQVDNATLQQLISAMAAPAPNAMHIAPPAGPNAQVDLHALLGALGGNASAHVPPAAGHAYGNAYGGQAAPHHGSGAGGAPTGDSAAQVQNIMAQLARYRQ